MTTDEGCIQKLALSKGILQPAITWPKLTIKTLDQAVKYVQVNNKDTPCSSFSIVNLEQVNTEWFELDHLIWTIAFAMT